MYDVIKRPWVEKGACDTHHQLFCLQEPFVNSVCEGNIMEHPVKRFRKCVPPGPRFLRPEDTHDLCLSCLGEEHICSVPEGSECFHCEKLRNGKSIAADLTTDSCQAIIAPPTMSLPFFPELQAKVEKLWKKPYSAIFIHSIMQIMQLWRVWMSKGMWGRPPLKRRESDHYRPPAGHMWQRVRPVEYCILWPLSMTTRWICWEIWIRGKDCLLMRSPNCATPHIWLNLCSALYVEHIHS